LIPPAAGTPGIRFWHKADITQLSSNVAIGGKADIGNLYGDPNPNVGYFHT
jgi:hypothetical protein